MDIILKPGQRIRTLGLYQPFATLMLHGKVETRFVQVGKKPPFPFGKYLIYSTKKCYEFHTAEELMGGHGCAAHEAFRDEMKIEGGTIDPCSKEFILGHAVCLGDMVEIIDPITSETKNTFVEYVEPCSRRRVGLVFQNIQRIKPFPFKGKQGIGFFPDNEIHKINFI